MDLAIESPTVSAKSWREFVINFLSDQMKYFNASNHFIREGRSVRRDYRSIVFAGFTRRIVPLIRLSVSHVVLRIFEWLPRRLRSLYGTSSSAERGRACSNNCVREEIAARYHSFSILG
jgi:hypothetical protein